MNDYRKITALYSRLSAGGEDRDGGESSIQNQKGICHGYFRPDLLIFVSHGTTAYWKQWTTMEITA